MKDLDVELARSWTAYEARLEQRLLGLGASQELQVLLPEGEDLQQRVIFERRGSGMIQAMLSLEYSQREESPDGTLVEALRAFDWAVVGHLAPRQIVRFEQVGELVSHVAGTLRVVLGVISPDFLDEHLATDAEDEAEVDDEGLEADDDEIDIDTEHFVAEPDSLEELHGLVARAVQMWVGGPVKVDGDGDYPVRHGSAIVYVRPCADQPAIVFWSVVARDIRKQAQATIEVNLLNRNHPGMTFTRFGPYVRVAATMPAMVFSSANFCMALSAITRVAHEEGLDLVERVGGETTLQEA